MHVGSNTLKQKVAHAVCVCDVSINMHENIIHAQITQMRVNQNPSIPQAIQTCVAPKNRPVYTHTHTHTHTHIHIYRHAKHKHHTGFNTRNHVNQAQSDLRSSTSSMCCSKGHAMSALIACPYAFL